MRALIVLLITVSLAKDSYSQRISLQNLLLVQNSSIVEAEGLLLDWGFSYGRDYGNVEEMETYSFQKNASNSLDYFNVTKYVYQGENIQTSFFTLNDKDYISIRRAVGTLGFEFVETTKSEEHGISVIHYYIKDGIEISLSISVTDKSHWAGADISMYHITIADIKNRRFYFNSTRY